MEERIFGDQDAGDPLRPMPLAQLLEKVNKKWL
jgi:hypothetical protein